MPKPVPLESLLKRGSAEFNKLRKAGQIPREHTGATITQVDGARLDLSGLALVGTEWDDCELEQATFAGADLSNAYFHGGALRDCDFQGANLSGATFEEVKLSRCDFTGAQGLEELELEKVDLHECRGLEEHEADADVPEGFPASYRRLPLEELVAIAAKLTRVKTGRGATDAEIRGLETELGVPFPGDYRAFLQRFGQLRVGDERGFLVFGLDDLVRARARFREFFEEWHRVPEGWLEKPVVRPALPKIEFFKPLPGQVEPTLEEKRRRLRDELGLEDAEVTPFFDDVHDRLRIAYRFMVPIIAPAEEFHRYAECLAPNGRWYQASVKEADITPSREGFTGLFLRYIDSTFGP
jgi:hypothetical protein